MDLGDYPGLGPGIVASLVVSLALCIPVGRVFRMASLNAWLLLFGLGLVFAATMTPSLEAITDGAVGTGRCDFSTLMPLPLGEFATYDERSLNVILYIPLGLAIGFAPRRSHQVELVIAAIVLPIAIEWLQLVVIQLDRQCQSADVADNLLGLALGLASGIAAGLLVRGIRRLVHRARDGAEPST